MLVTRPGHFTPDSKLGNGFIVSDFFLGPQEIIWKVNGNVFFSDPTTRMSLLDQPAFGPVHSSTVILRTCLSYLSNMAIIIDNDPIDFMTTILQVETRFPLAAYIGLHLLSHARESGTDHGVCQLLMDFFENHRIYSIWSCLHQRLWLPYSQDVPSPLWTACSAGLLPAVRKIVEGGAELNRMDSWHDKNAPTPLLVACQFGYRDVADFLIERGADINAWAGSYGTPLQTACFFNRTEMVRLLLEKGANPNIQKGKYGTALQIAVLSADKELIRLLISGGANVNELPSSRPLASALYSACQHKRIDIVELLLDSGADITLHSQYTGPPIAAAVSAGSEDLIRLLISRGANFINHVCANLWDSPRKDWANTLRILLDAGLNANARDYGGDTMLHRATAYGAKDAVELLLQHGADVNLTDRNAVTPLYLASIARRGEIWDLLKAAGGVE